MATALDRVISNAETAAENLPAAQSQVNTNLVQTNQQANRPSLDSMADSAGIQVDDYLTVKDTGFRVGDAKNEMFKKVKARIDLNEVVAISVIRATRSGATTFIKSYDGLTTSQGQSFALAEQQARQISDKVDGPYQTAEIPVLLLEKVPGAAKDTRIGITPSITGVKFFTKFYNELRRLGLASSVVDVELTHLYQSNKAGNEWGVVEFNLIGEVEPSE
jgi:hypothetical protein